MTIFKAGDKVRIINAMGQPDKLMVIPDIEHVGKVGVITASFHYQHGNIESDYDCMAEVTGRIKNQTWGNWQRVFRTPVAAGFTDGFNCWGESETLRMKSRGEEDAKLIKSRSR